MRRPEENKPMDTTDTDDIGAAIRAISATVQAPASLREALVDQQVATQRRRRRARGLLASLAGVAAATAAALVLTLPGAGAPSVADAASLALASPSAAAPAPGARPGTLNAAVGNVSFPRLPGWRPVGSSSGTLHGRDARTVVYEDSTGRRVGYTIVDGDPLSWPKAPQRELGGVRIATWRQDGASVATWRRDGRTCVLASKAAPQAMLASLAAGY
jgi:hypothetical protein